MSSVSEAMLVPASEPAVLSLLETLTAVPCLVDVPFLADLHRMILSHLSVYNDCSPVGRVCLTSKPSLGLKHHTL